MRFIVNITSFLFSLTGVLLITRGFGFLGSKNWDPKGKITRKARYGIGVFDGGGPIEESEIQYIERRHEALASKIGSFFVLLSIVIRQIPHFETSFQLLGTQVLVWVFYVMTLLLSCLGALGISKILRRLIRKEVEDRFN